VPNILPNHEGTETATQETGTTTATANVTENGIENTENEIDVTMTTMIANQDTETPVTEGPATCGILENLSTVRGNENTGTLGIEICEIHGTYEILAT
jgi:hypothetical protein